MATHDAEHRQFVGAARRPQNLEIRSPAGPLNGFEPHPRPRRDERSAMLDRGRVRHPDHRQRQRLDDLCHNLWRCSRLTHGTTIQRTL